MLYYLFRNMDTQQVLEASCIGGENHQPVSSHWQILSHDVVSPDLGFELTTLVMISTHCIGSCKSNYHTIMTMTAPYNIDTRCSYIYL